MYASLNSGHVTRTAGRTEMIEMKKMKRVIKKENLLNKKVIQSELQQRKLLSLLQTIDVNIDHAKV